MGRKRCLNRAPHFLPGLDGFLGSGEGVKKITINGVKVSKPTQGVLLKALEEGKNVTLEVSRKYTDDDHAYRMYKEYPWDKYYDDEQHLGLILEERDLLVKKSMEEWSNRQYTIDLSKELVTGKAKKIVDKCREGKLGSSGEIALQGSPTDLKILQRLQKLREYDSNPALYNYESSGIADPDIARELAANSVAPSDIKRYQDAGVTDINDVLFFVREDATVEIPALTRGSYILDISLKQAYTYFKENPHAADTLGALEEYGLNDFGRDKISFADLDKLMKSNITWSLVEDYAKAGRVTVKAYPYDNTDDFFVNKLNVHDFVILATELKLTPPQFNDFCLSYLDAENRAEIQPEKSVVLTPQTIKRGSIDLGVSLEEFSWTPTIDLLRKYAEAF